MVGLSSILLLFRAEPEMRRPSSDDCPSERQCSLRIVRDRGNDV